MRGRTNLSYTAGSNRLRLRSTSFRDRMEGMPSNEDNVFKIYRNIFFNIYREDLIAPFKVTAYVNTTHPKKSSGG